MPQLDPIQLSMLLVLLGALAAYPAMRLLWAGAGGGAIGRGVLVAGPVVVLALLFVSSGSGGLALALLCTASVLMLTLGLGVSAASAPTAAGIASPSLRLLAPLTACTFVVGVHGEMTLLHALALAMIAGLVLWSVPTAAVQTTAPRRRGAWLAIGVPLVLIATVLVARGAGVFVGQVSSVVVTPVVVLMVAPALLLALLGLLAAESRRGEGGEAIDTITGFVATCVGGQALAILAAHARRAAAMQAGGSDGAVTPASWTPFATTVPTTQPAADTAAIVMPLATWRVDSVLLTVLAIVLLPVGTGHLRLGKIEGLALIGLYLFYASVATHTGAR